MKQVSGPHKIAISQSKIYTLLSDFRNIEPHLDKIREKGVQLTVIDNDRCEIAVPMAGNITLYFKERTPESKLVLASAESPLPLSFSLTILIEAISDKESNLTVDIQADLPAIMEMMAKPLFKKATGHIGEIFTKLPYDKLQ